MTEIVEAISRGLIDGKSTVREALAAGFGVEDDVALLRARALTVQHLEEILAQVEHDEEVAEVVEQFCQILARSNLDHRNNIVWGRAHLATMKMLLRSYRQSEGVKISLEIGRIIEEIRALDADERQREMLEEIFTAIEEFHEAHPISGEKAYNALFLRLIGILAIYHDVFRNAPGPMKKKIATLLKTVGQAKELSEAAVAIGQNVGKLIGMF